MNEQIIQKVNKYMSEEDMLTSGQHIILGVSGGADSVCLLFVLLSLRESMDLKLTAVHVNHGLRGSQADADEAYVVQLCKDKNVPCEVFHIDIRDFSRQQGCSEEEGGRIYRYQCFEKILESVGGDKIAVAHNQNDLSETVLLNIFRGTGLKGLSGIPAVRDSIIRPLLCLSRDEIEMFLNEQRIPYRTDSTNFETDYTRNRIRLDILPYVSEHINASAGQHLVQLAEMAGQVNRFVSQTAASYFETIADKERGSIHVPPFEVLDPVIRREMIRQMISRKAGHLKDITFSHIRDVDALTEKPVGKMVNLPYGLTAVRTYDCIHIERRNQQAPVNGVESIDLFVPGSYEIPSLNLKVELALKKREENERIPEKNYTKWFDYDKIKVGLKLRKRQPGDYIIINSQGNKKPVTRVMIDEKVPKESRETMPLIADGEHVLWIPGLRISEAYKITKHTVNILVVKIKEKMADGRQDQSIINREGS